MTIDARLAGAILIFLFASLVGVIKWLLVQHEHHIVDAIHRMERRMDKFEDAQKEDSERFHQIEMEIKGQHAIFVPRAEFGAYCSLAKQGGKRFFDPPTECG